MSCLQPVVYINWNSLGGAENWQSFWFLCFFVFLDLIYTKSKLKSKYLFVKAGTNASCSLGRSVVVHAFVTIFLTLLIPKIIWRKVIHCAILGRAKKVIEVHLDTMIALRCENERSYFTDARVHHSLYRRSFYLSLFCTGVLKRKHWLQIYFSLCTHMGQSC